MICLGIESSCDETSLALVKDGGLVGQVLASQSDIHALFGGVVPEIASREHYRCMGVLCDALLNQTDIRYRDISCIGVSRGPGLLGGLLTGVAFAKALAMTCEARFLGINHLHAHLLSVGLEHDLTFPCLGLLVSGGHTQLYLLESPSKLTILGSTLDDAVGEAFDKIGTLLGMPYPCGAMFDEIAQRGKVDPQLFPRPYLKNDNLDFSFSGLKTAACQLYLQRLHERFANFHFSALPHNVPYELADFIASFNFAIVDTIIVKLKRALALFPHLKTLVIAGGVAANSMLRKEIARTMEDSGGRVLCPSKALCTDNGAMIAYTSWLLGQDGFHHSLDIPTIPRGTPIPEDMCLSAIV